jgi:hypothetical protein
MPKEEEEEGRNYVLSQRAEVEAREYIQIRLQIQNFTLFFP